MCTEKTGTLTEASLRVVALIPADGTGKGDLAQALGHFAASAPSPNATLDAVHAAQLAGDPALEPTAQVPFSLRRRWSALELDGELKQARLAIAQGSGTQMARSVSDLVLASGEFGEVPRMVHEGGQILRNIQRVARLFVTKAISTAFLLITVAIPSGVFPLLPRQFTLTSSLTIGIPAFFLALAPSRGQWRPEGFLRATARFSFAGGTRDRHRHPVRLPSRASCVRRNAD